MTATTTPTPATSAAPTLGLASFTRAFETWEQRFRQEPASFLTADETARMEIASVSEARAIYFNALLRDTATAMPTIGTAFEGGFFGGLIRIGEQLHAIVWSPKALGQLKGKWGPSKDVKGACSYFDSMANTVAMATAGSALAKKALALDINGYTDWCLPARDVLELGYRHMKPTKESNYVYRSGDNPSSVPAGYPYTEDLPAQTALADFQEGGSEAFPDAWMWSSTQYSESNAWLQHFSKGYQNSSRKSYEAGARAVRMIPVAP